MTVDDSCTFSWLESTTPTLNNIWPSLQRVYCTASKAVHTQMAMDGIVCQRNCWPFLPLNRIREESLSLAWFHIRFFEEGDWDKNLSCSYVDKESY